MKTFLQRQSVFFILALLLSVLSLPALAAQPAEQKPISLRTMGSLMFGGTVDKLPNGETFHGDHGYAQYYIPFNARQYPIVMWHGIGQSGKSWESTPDGREGYQAILPRRDWPVYIIDQPRRGRAGYTNNRNADPSANPTTSLESAVWDAFRVGTWVPPHPATVHTGAQFPVDGSTVDQFFRQQTPDTGPEPFPSAEHRMFMARTMGELFKQTGPVILMTHSHSGQYGWATAMANPDQVKAIVAYEPGSMAFPEGEQLEDVPARHAFAGEVLGPQWVSKEEFMKLTKMPILVIYGDNISSELSDIFNVEVWRIASTRAKQFVDTVNKYGGDATLVLLPEIGIKGNTHAPFADLNNLEIADHLEKWLQEKKLDGRATPHTGPRKIDMQLTIPLGK